MPFIVCYTNALFRAKINLFSNAVHLIFSVKHLFCVFLIFQDWINTAPRKVKEYHAFVTHRQLKNILITRGHGGPLQGQHSCGHGKHAR